MERIWKMKLNLENIEGLHVLGFRYSHEGRRKVILFRGYIRIMKKKMESTIIRG